MLAAVIAAAALAAPPPAAPPELVSLFRQSSLAPPELAAQILLRLAAHPAWPADLKIAALETAFNQAAQARESFPWKLAPGRPSHGHASWISRGYELELDRLSLQSRAVIALAALRPPAARDLFARMPYPVLRSLDCLEELVPFPDLYFAAAAAVSRPGLPPTVLQIVESIRYPSEIAPALRLLAHPAISPFDRLALESRLALALKSLTADDRSFSASLEAVFAALAAAPNLATPWRDLVARHLRQPRCEDTAFDQFYNERLAKRLGLPSPVPPAELLQSAPVTEDGPGAELESRLRALEQESSQPLPAWLPKLQAFHENLAADSGLPLRIRGPLALRSAALLPPGDERSRLLRSLVSWMNEGALSSNAGLLWLASCDHILRSAESAPAALRAELHALLLQSPNTALALWVRLNLVLPRGQNPSRP